SSTSPGSPRRRATPPRCAWASPSAARSRSCGARRSGPPRTGATTCCPTTSRTSRSRRGRTASCSTRRRSSPARPTRPCWAGSSRTSPRRRSAAPPDAVGASRRPAPFRHRRTDLPHRPRAHRMNASSGPSPRSGSRPPGTAGTRTASSALAGLLQPLVAAVRRALAPVGRALAPAVQAVGPVTSAVSPFGWAALVATVAAWWAGLALSWLELLVVAVLLTVSLVAAVAFVLGRFRYAVVLDLAQQRVTVGDRAVGRLDVRNDSARPLLPSVMELPVGQGMATFPVPRLRPQASHEEIFTVPTHRRSVISVGPVRSVRADPLGLLRREVVWTEPEELFVHPRVKNLSGSSTGFLKDLEGRVTTDISNS